MEKAEGEAGRIAWGMSTIEKQIEGIVPTVKSIAQKAQEAVLNRETSANNLNKSIEEQIEEKKKEEKKKGRDSSSDDDEETKKKRASESGKG